MASNGNNLIRGGIYWVNLDPTVGSESKKTRPAIIVSNEIQNKISSRVIVVPLTSNIKSIYPFEAEIVVQGKKAKAMADQIRTIDKIRINNFISKSTKDEMNRLEQAIRLVIGLD